MLPISKTVPNACGNLEGNGSAVISSLLCVCCKWWNKNSYYTNDTVSLFQTEQEVLLWITVYCQLGNNVNESESTAWCWFGWVLLPWVFSPVSTPITDMVRIQNTAGVAYRASSLCMSWALYNKIETSYSCPFRWVIIRGSFRWEHRTGFAAC